MAVALCEGPVSAVRRIWLDSELVYDTRAEIQFQPGDTLEIKSLSGITIREGVSIRTYLGTSDQAADPTIESIEGTDNTPAYRDTCYIVFENLLLTEFGNRRPNVRAEVLRLKTDNVWFNDPGISGSSLIFAWDPITGYLAAISAGANLITIYDPATGGIITQWTIPDDDFGLGYDITAFYDGVLYGGGFDENGNDAHIATFNAFTGSRIAVIAQKSLPGHGVLEFTDISYVIVTKGWIFGESVTDDKVYVFLNDWLTVIDPTTGFSLLSAATLIVTITAGNTSGFSNYMSEPDSDYVWITDDDATNGSTLWLLGPGGTLNSLDLQNAFDSLGDPIGGGTPVAADNLWKIGFGGAYDPVTQSIIVYSDDDNSGTYLPEGLYRLECTTPHDLTTCRIAASNTTDDIFRDRENYLPWPLDGDGYYWGFEIPTGDLDLIEFNTDDLTVNRQIDFTGTAPGVILKYAKKPGEKLMAVDPAITSDASAIGWDRISQVDQTLDVVVSEICLQHGLTADEIDVTDLATVDVRGYAVRERNAGRRQIEQLMSAYFFDAVESDGKLKFNLKTSKTFSTLIPSTDLAVHEPGTQLPPDLTYRRQEEIGLPRAVEVTHISQDLDYEASVQYSQKQISPSESIMKLQLPISLTNQEAVDISQRWMESMRAERHEGQITLSMKYLSLDPTDGITIERGNFLETVDVIGIEFSPPTGIMQVSFRTFDIDAYQATATPVAQLGYLSSRLSNAPASAFIQIDSPPLRDIDNGPGFYWAVAPFNSLTDWDRADVVRVPSDEASQSVFNTFASAFSSAKVGSATDVLGTFATPGVWDYVNTVNVRLWNSQTLSNATELEVLNGANPLFFPQSNELIQFQTATLEANGSYTLSNLLRGRKATEYGIDLHFSGEYVVFLDSSTIYNADDSLGNRNRSFEYKAVTNNRTIQSTPGFQWSSQYHKVKPRSPVQLDATRETNSDLTLGWIRRARLNNEWLDDIDVPLDETSELYDIELYTGTTLLRTVSGVGPPSYVYTIADQTTDNGGAVSTDFNFKVYQLSDRVGRGVAGESANFNI
jgi:hypothetical protein